MERNEGEIVYFFNCAGASGLGRLYSGRAVRQRCETKKLLGEIEALSEAFDLADKRIAASMDISSGGTSLGETQLSELIIKSRAGGGRDIYVSGERALDEYNSYEHESWLVDGVCYSKNDYYTYKHYWYGSEEDFLSEFYSDVGVPDEGDLEWIKRISYTKSGKVEVYTLVMDSDYIMDFLELSGAGYETGGLEDVKAVVTFTDKVLTEIAVSMSVQQYGVSVALTLYMRVHYTFSFPLVPVGAVAIGGGRVVHDTASAATLNKKTSEFFSAAGYDISVEYYLSDGSSSVLFGSRSGGRYTESGVSSGYKKIGYYGEEYFLNGYLYSYDIFDEPTVAKGNFHSFSQEIPRFNNKYSVNPIVGAAYTENGLTCVDVVYNVSDYAAVVKSYEGMELHAENVLFLQETYRYDSSGLCAVTLTVAAWDWVHTYEIRLNVRNEHVSVPSDFPFPIMGALDLAAASGFDFTGPSGLFWMGASAFCGDKLLLLSRAENALYVVDYLTAEVKDIVYFAGEPAGICADGNIAVIAFGTALILEYNVETGEQSTYETENNVGAAALSGTTLYYRVANPRIESEVTLYAYDLETGESRLIEHTSGLWISEFRIFAVGGTLAVSYSVYEDNYRKQITKVYSGDGTPRFEREGMLYLLAGGGIYIEGNIYDSEMGELLGVNSFNGKYKLQDYYTVGLGHLVYEDDDYVVVSIGVFEKKSGKFIYKTTNFDALSPQRVTKIDGKLYICVGIDGGMAIKCLSGGLSGSLGIPENTLPAVPLEGAEDSGRYMTDYSYVHGGYYYTVSYEYSDTGNAYVLKRYNLKDKTEQSISIEEYLPESSGVYRWFTAGGRLVLNFSGKALIIDTDNFAVASFETMAGANIAGICGDYVLYKRYQYDKNYAHYYLRSLTSGELIKEFNFDDQGSAGCLTADGSVYIFLNEDLKVIEYIIETGETREKVLGWSVFADYVYSTAELLFVGNAVFSRSTMSLLMVGAASDYYNRVIMPVNGIIIGSLILSQDGLTPVYRAYNDMYRVLYDEVENKIYYYSYEDMQNYESWKVIDASALEPVTG